MAKILYCQDSHIRGKNTENRKGDYYAEIMAKIKEVLDIGKKEKVDMIIHGGDLYDSETVSNIMVDDFIDLVESYKIPWYIVPGNHDEIGHSWNLSQASSLAHIFRRSKLISRLDQVICNKSFLIKGYEYYHNIETDIKDKGLYADKKFPTKGLKIAIVHALITENPLPYSAMHICYKNIKTDFNYLLTAHNHQPFSAKIGNTKIIDIGCLGRRKIDEKDIKPSCLLIDTDTKDFKIIELKSVKKAEEVFDLKKVEEQNLFEGEINKFIKSLSDVKLQGLDIRGMIELIGKEKQIEKSVIEECVKRIGKFE